MRGRTRKRGTNFLNVWVLKNNIQREEFQMMNTIYMIAAVGSLFGIGHITLTRMGKEGAAGLLYGIFIMGATAFLLQYVYGLFM